MYYLHIVKFSIFLGWRFLLYDLVICWDIYSNLTRRYH